MRCVCVCVSVSVLESNLQPGEVNLAQAYDTIARFDAEFTVRDFNNFLAYRKTISATAPQLNVSTVSPDFFPSWITRIALGRGLPSVNEGKWMVCDFFSFFLSFLFSFLCCASFSVRL